MCVQGEMVRRPEGLTPPILPGVETVCEAPRFILPVRLPRLVLEATPGEAFETRILSTVEVDVGILAREVDPARFGVMVAELGMAPWQRVQALLLLRLVDLDEERGPDLMYDVSGLFAVLIVCFSWLV